MAKNEAMKMTKHENAWRVLSDDSDEYGVLVECGPRTHPYWWVLCPATSTLYLDDSRDLLGCSDASCMWEDVHRNANSLWLHLRRSQTNPAESVHGPS